MRTGRAGFRFVAALILGWSVTAGPAASATVAGESYFSLERLKVPFATGETYHRLLVVEIDLAVATPEDKVKVKALRQAIEDEIEKALGAKPVAEFEAGNLASIVKRIARGAAQRAAGDVKIGDALIRNARLL